MGTVRFTVCPDRHGSACDIGGVPTGQTDQLQASFQVRKGAAVGEHVQLTAHATASDASASRASATVVVTASSPSPSPSPPAGGGSLPTLPALPGSQSSPGNPSGLFPTVSPNSSASPGSAATTQNRRHRNHVTAATASATLPLNPRLIGGQLAGLAVLAGAIAMAIARLSLRAPRPQGGKDASQ
jgi:hypothetical protein